MESWNQRDQRGGTDFLQNPGNLCLKTRPAYTWTKVRGPLDSVTTLLSKCWSPKVALVDSWLYNDPTVCSMVCRWDSKAGGAPVAAALLLPGLPSKLWWGQREVTVAAEGLVWVLLASLPDFLPLHASAQPCPPHLRFLLLFYRGYPKAKGSAVHL